ncbi:PREDICTED: zinc transporter 10 [Chaetura pelagica]|uniref:zinc transporter 10 n=1 Tax=Chaetura pelagica TaxID=8897 RepID=UPI0005238D88|nr:PREDICTED: zinc transporter 10 [Chaetura pelagica]
MGRYTGRTSRLIFMLVLTVGFFVAELVSGYLGNSIALVSDSFNMLSDLISLCVGLSTGRIARRSRRGPRATYVFVEAALRLASPEPIDDAQLVLIVGTLGLAVNLVGLLVFQDWSSCCRCHRPPSPAPPGMEDEAGDSPNDQKSPEEGPERKKPKKSEALNIRGVLLHVMGDALGSVVVVVAATIFQVLPLGDAPCNWQCYIDPSLTIIMVFIILSSAFPLIKETSTILLQMVPKGVNMQVLTDRLARVPGVSSLHEVHVWELAGGKNIATLHIKCQTPTDYQDAAYKIRKVFHDAGVHSVTIQPEYIDHKTSQLLCSSPCISKSCDSQLCCSQREPSLAKTNGYTEKNNSHRSALRKDNGSSRSDIEIPIESPLAEDSIKNVKTRGVSDDKSQLSSTRL